ncbi:MAG: Lipopolysaccharide core heptosyltransferase RfaQ [Bryobacteraceae bacterium]|nr:Lipopolysaccharide core heptosyltransferase RfaQ [Bryobacteraceae bacterium]MCC6341453.1 glycosyltransferase family 9 protein [Bryobacterales bacterium]
MIRFLDQLGKGAHVAVVRLRSLGDCVLTTPALYLLKRFRPDLRVGVVVEPRFEAVFEESPDVDDILPPSASLLLRYRPQLCLNLHGGTRSLLLTMASAARWRAGFAHYRFSRFYNVLIPRAQEILHVKRKVHTAEHVASAMFHLGVPQDEIPRARLHARPIHSSTPYAVFHALASSPLKTWPAARFLELAAFVQSRLELEPLFIGAHGDDLTPFQRFRTQTLPLQETKSVLAGAALFIGNDSGPAHMAAAFGIPEVVLFGASDPVVWAPWKTHAEAIVSSGGMSSITVERVARAAGKLRVTA